MLNQNNINNNKSHKKIFIWSGLLIIFMLAVFFTGGYYYGKISEGKITYNFDSDLYQETELPDVFKNTLTRQIWNIIQTDFVDKDEIDEQKLFYGALSGMVGALDDPYSSFLDPYKSEDLELAMSGEFEGIGAEITQRDGIVTIVSPIGESPAKLAGLKPGDKIFAVDDVDIIGMNLDEAVRLIRGEKGTTVKLLVSSDGELARDVEIVRAKIEMKSVEWEYIENDLVHVHFKSFNHDTLKLFNEMIKEIESKQIKGLIIDVRNNPGGLLTTANSITSLWVDNKPIVIEKFSEDRENVNIAEEGAQLLAYPTVILINQGSASGSEIFAGALQDYEIAPVIGMQSFGKGSVQIVKKLPDGSAIKVTIGKWYTPNGRIIEEEGITPDIEIDYTQEDVDAGIDPQLQKAIDMLK